VYQWCNPDDGTAVVRFTFAAEAVRHEPERPLDQASSARYGSPSPNCMSGRHALSGRPWCWRACGTTAAELRSALELLSEVRSAVAQGVA
jgi:hypothetical protein